MEFSSYFRFIMALVFVLALIALAGWAVRRFGGLRMGIPARAGNRRLEIVEIAPIDSKRRLVLVKRDDTEHLLLLGITQDLVVETGISSHRTGTAPGAGQAKAAG